jgi:signal transduction histidine kinase
MTDLPPRAIPDNQEVTAHSAVRPQVPGGDLSNLQRQESTLILLNLGVLGVLIGIHLLFAPFVRTSVSLAVGLFAGRFVMQVLELAWLRGRFAQPSEAAIRRYAQFAVWINVAFASLASLVSGVPHSHYVVLMVLPTIAAAFRATCAGLAAVVAVAIGVTLLYVGVYQTLGSSEERTNEFFEAATDTLTYLAVAVVVRLLIVQLRLEQKRLHFSLAELEQTRDRLVSEEKLAAVGRLSAAVAHEIRNPVGMIASAVGAARRANYEPGVRDEMNAIIEQESRRLERLTNEFLSFARPGAPRCQPASVRTALEYVTALVKPRAAESGVSVKLDCPQDGEAFFDAAQIHQALLNLATNALDATPPGGQIILGAEPPSSGGTVLFVANEGPPIPVAVRARLFEPFFTTKPGGTGLGLAISQKVARAHGGDLLLTKNGPDQVRFSLLLPVPPERGHRREEAHGANSDSG